MLNYFSKEVRVGLLLYVVSFHVSLMYLYGRKTFFVVIIYLIICVLKWRGFVFPMLSSHVYIHLACGISLSFAFVVFKGLVVHILLFILKNGVVSLHNNILKQFV